MKLSYKTIYEPDFSMLNTNWWYVIEPFNYKDIIYNRFYLWGSRKTCRLYSTLTGTETICNLDDVSNIVIIDNKYKPPSPNI